MVAVDDNRSKFTAQSALGIAGNVTTVILLVVPMFTFVRPIWNDGSVGDRTVHAYLVAMFNSVMWALYAAASLPAGTLPFFYINELGVLLQLFYIILYLGFSAKEKQRGHGLALLAVDAVCVMMTALVYFVVMVTHRWSVTFVAVIASAMGVSMHAIPLFDLVALKKSPIKALITLVNASIWATYGFRSVPVNIYVVVPNLAGVLSASLQILVYLLVRSIRADEVVDKGDLSASQV